MTEFKIEKGIPSPKEIRRGFTAAVHALGVGESFTCDFISSTGLQYAKSKLPDREFTRRKEKGIIRIWRTK